MLAGNGGRGEFAKVNSEVFAAAHLQEDVVGREEGGALTNRGAEHAAPAGRFAGGNVFHLHNKGVAVGLVRKADAERYPREDSGVINEFFHRQASFAGKSV